MMSIRRNVDCREKSNAYLCILELLLNFLHESFTGFACKATKEQFWPDLARARHSSADAHQSPDLVRPEIADCRNQRQMVKSNAKLARLQVCRIHCGRCRIDFEVFRFIVCNQVVKGLAKIWKKSIILSLDGIGENVILLQEMAVVNVESS